VLAEGGVGGKDSEGGEIKVGVESADGGGDGEGGGEDATGTEGIEDAGDVVEEEDK
jgi:hypothetical protein